MQASSILNDQKPVIRVSGQIDFSSRKPLQAMIDDGLAQGQRHFVLDLQGVTFIDSSGLGALVACFSTVRKRGGSMTLMHVPEPVYELMEMTRLTHFFDIYDRAQPAPQSLAGPLTLQSAPASDATSCPPGAPAGTSEVHE